MKRALDLNRHINEEKHVALVDNGPSTFLFSGYCETIVAHGREDVAEGPDLIDKSVAKGCYCAGFISYEAGYSLEPKLAGITTRDVAIPLLSFGVFRQRETVELVQSARSRPVRIGPLCPMISKAAYLEKLAETKCRIADGDIYQLNLTFPCEIEVDGDPADICRSIRARARSGFSAMLRTDDRWLLSFSPELFFEVEENTIACRPMKGTAARTGNEDDAPLAKALRSDIKQRAENLMIVDLMRNDMSRLCEAGSVRVPELFTIETYPTVLQMTSTVTGDSPPGTVRATSFARSSPAARSPARQKSERCNLSQKWKSFHVAPTRVRSAILRPMAARR